jgi:hypothetical protein
VFDQTCAGRCNAPARRKQDQYDRDLATWQAAMQKWMTLRENGEDAGEAPEKPREREIFWTAGTPLWCLSDAAAIRSALTDLDDIVPIRLRHADGLQASGQTEPVGGSKERPSPSSAMDDLSELLDWLRGWEAAYRTSQGWPTAPYRGHSIPALTSSIAWHLGHLDGILAHPGFTTDDAGEDLGAVAYGLGVLHWHSRWEASAKTREKARWIARELRCPQCHAKTLAQLEGEEKVECRNPRCGEDRGGPAIFSLDEYVHHVGEATAEAKAAAKLARMEAA